MPYKETFPHGSSVRIANRASLENFMASWPHRNKLQSEQLEYAGVATTVKKVGFYHGDDSVYELAGIPGVWREQCLAPG